MYEIEKYKKIIQEERISHFKQPYELVYDNFLKLGYDKHKEDFFINNASSIIENLRMNCWNDFIPIEKNFTFKMLKILIDPDHIKKLTSFDSIVWFIENFPEHIYNLILSNTQSRRSRAGKEFEAIIELIMIGAGVSIDSQANIGKQEFIDKGLGKLVDLVSPSILEYTINKRNTVLVSAKTTLRERWQEVPEEVARTGAREMFLATLDKSISVDVLNTLYEANIQIVTTKNIKNTFYENNKRIITFEELLTICLDNSKIWNSFNYSKEQNLQRVEFIERQILKHSNHKFVQEYYKNRLNGIKL